MTLAQGAHDMGRLPDRAGVRRVVALGLVAGALLASGSAVAAAPCAVTDFPCHFKAITDHVRSVGQSVSNVLSKVVDTGKKVTELTLQLQAVKKFTDQVQATADAALTVAQQAQGFITYHVTAEMAAYQEFVGPDGKGGTSRVFKEQLIGLVTSLEGAVNGVLGMERALVSTPGVDANLLRLPDIDLSLVKVALTAIPPFVLYPSYRAIKMHRTGEDKPLLKALTDITEAIRNETAAIANLPDVFADCPSVMAPAIRAKLARTSTVLKAASSVKLLGEILKATGKTSPEATNAGLAAGGHVSLKVNHNYAGSLGTFLIAFSNGALSVAKTIDARLEHCEIVVNQETIMKMLEAPGTPREKCLPTPKYTTLGP